MFKDKCTSTLQIYTASLRTSNSLRTLNSKIFFSLGNKIKMILVKKEGNVYFEFVFNSFHVKTVISVFLYMPIFLSKVSKIHSYKDMVQERLKSIL